MRSGGTGILGTWSVACREDGVRLSPLLVCAGARFVGSISPSPTTLNKVLSLDVSTLEETDRVLAVCIGLRDEGSGMVLGLARGGICGVAVGIFGRVISSFAPAHCLFMDCVSHLLSAFGNCNFSFAP